MKKRQTAVEWLYEHILLTPLDIRSINKCLEQAKEMEKQQIVDAYVYGSAYGIDFNEGLNPMNYYKETYESNT